MTPTMWFPAGVGGHRARGARAFSGWGVVTRCRPAGQDTGPSVALGSQPLCCCPVCSHVSQVPLLSQAPYISSLSPAPGSYSVLGPARAF